MAPQLFRKGNERTERPKQPISTEQLLHQTSAYWESRRNPPMSPHRQNFIIRNGELIQCAANHIS